MSVLQEALRRAQDERDRGRGIEPAARPQLAPSRAPEASARPTSPLFALGLAVAIFAAVVTAWHTQPELRDLPRPKLETQALKLDYGLDLDRKPSPAGTTPP